MGWRPQLNERGVIARFSNSDTGEVISAQEYERRMQTLQGGYTPNYPSQPSLTSVGGTYTGAPYASVPQTSIQSGMQPSSQPTGPYAYQTRSGHSVLVPPDNNRSAYPQQYNTAPDDGVHTRLPAGMPSASFPTNTNDNPLIQPGAHILRQIHRCRSQLLL